MMTGLIGFGIGLVIGAIVSLLVYLNNKKRIESLEEQVRERINK